MTSQIQSSRESTGTRADESGPVSAGPSARTKLNEKKSAEKPRAEAEAAGARPDLGLESRGRLQNVLLWLQTAKENLPDLNNGQIPADRVAAASALVDRLHRLALEAAAHGTSRGQRQHRAA